MWRLWLSPRLPIGFSANTIGTAHPLSRLKLRCCLCSIPRPSVLTAASIVAMLNWMRLSVLRAQQHGHRFIVYSIQVHGSEDCMDARNPLAYTLKWIGLEEEGPPTHPLHLYTLDYAGAPGIQRRSWTVC